MRNIKLRAFDKTEGKMIRPPVDLMKLLSQVSNRYDNSTGGDAIRNHDLIWMEYTGIVDSKGVEIYEGDYLVEDAEDGWSGGLVKFEDGAFRIQLTPQNDTSPGRPRGHNLGNYYLSDRAYYQLRVVGNFFENPELIQN